MTLADDGAVALPLAQTFCFPVLESRMRRRLIDRLGDKKGCADADQQDGLCGRGLAGGARQTHPTGRAEPSGARADPGAVRAPRHPRDRGSRH